MIGKVVCKSARICSLDKVKIGERAKVLGQNQTNKFLARRMFEMGLTSGVIVKVKKTAPLGDPISIELRGYELCLRKKELKNIRVEIL